MSPLTLALALLLLQYPYPARRVPPGQNVPDTRGTNTDAVATFDGRFRSADKKFLLIEVEGGQTMRLYLTHSTRFFRDDKAAKPSDFHPGDRVTVEASRDQRLNMLADRVTAIQPRPPAEGAKQDGH